MMDANSALERFCYLGTLLPHYVQKKEHIKVSSLLSQVDALITRINGSDYIHIIGNCLKNQHLPRKDEIWFTYAAYLINNSIQPNDKKMLKQTFSQYAKNSEDLFLFAKYARDILNEQKRKGFSGPIKDTITLWYATQDNHKLIEMIGINRGMYSFQHKDLITLCHINLKLIGKQDIEKYLFKKCNKFVKELEINTNNDGISSSGGNDSAGDSSANSSSNQQQISESLKNLSDVCKLKITTDPNIAKEIIKKKQIQFEHVPKHLLKRVDIWEALIPNISYRTLLKSIHFIIETKMLGSVSFNKAYFSALNNHELMRKEKLHPIFFLIERNKQMKGMRYSEKVKQSYYTKKIQKMNIEPNPKVDKKLTNLFVTSFDSLQPIGLRMFITINLQENYKRKTVCNQRQITCMQAAVTLAFSYYKSEKETAVYTYCSDNSKLNPIPWTKDCNYKKANELCENLIGKKNFQRTHLPIVEALKAPEQYDLFLVIVPSAARGNPGFKNKKVVEILKMYRRAKNQKARMVFVNLRRFKPAMIHEASVDNGILEICGFDENTPKLINAFALNYFS